MVEPLDHAVPFGQIPYTILSSHGGHRPYDLRILRILVIEGVDEVDITFQRGPQSLVYSNHVSRQKMRLSRMEVVGELAQPLSSVV